MAEAARKKTAVKKVVKKTTAKAQGKAAARKGGVHEIHSVLADLHSNISKHLDHAAEHSKKMLATWEKKATQLKTKLTSAQGKLSKLKKAPAAKKGKALTAAQKEQAKKKLSAHQDTSKLVAELLSEHTVTKAGADAAKIAAKKYAALVKMVKDFEKKWEKQFAAKAKKAKPAKSAAKKKAVKAVAKADKPAAAVKAAKPAKAKAATPVKAKKAVNKTKVAKTTQAPAMKAPVAKPATAPIHAVTSRPAAQPTASHSIGSHPVAPMSQHKPEVKPIVLNQGVTPPRKVEQD